MAEDPIAFLREATRSPSRMAEWSGPGAVSPAQVRFDRRELNQILTIYGRMVAAGEWRDYAIDFLSDRALFSIYRRSSEVPLYTVEKQPRLRGRQGQYSILAAGGQIMKRGHELPHLLRYFERKLIKALSVD